MNPIKNRVNSIFVFAFIFSLITFTIQFYFPILYVELGFNPIQIGTIVALSFLINFVLPTPIGLFCDRTDIRKLILLSILLWFLFFVGMIHTQEVLLITALVLLFRSANFISKTSLDNIILKLKKKSKNKLIGHYLFFSYIGVSAGMVLGGFILLNFGFENLFIYMALAIVILSPTVFLLPKIRYTETKIEQYKSDLFNKKVAIISLVLFLYALHYGAEHISYSLFLKDNLGLGFLQIGYYMAAAVFVMSFGAFYSGKIINKSNIFLVFGIGLLVSGIGHILMTQGDLFFSLFFRIFHEIGDAIESVSFLFFLQGIFPKKRIGGNSGFLLVSVALGSIVGSFLFSSIGFGYGHQWSLIISGILTILASVIILSSRKYLIS